MTTTNGTNVTRSEERITTAAVIITANSYNELSERSRHYTDYG